MLLTFFVYDKQLYWINLSKKLKEAVAEFLQTNN